jgi:hypothetical protein
LVTEYSLIDLHQLKILLLAKLIAFCILQSRTAIRFSKTKDKSGIRNIQIVVVGVKKNIRKISIKN